MKRSAMKQRKKPMARGKPMRRRSKKMEAKYAGKDGRRAFVERMLKAHPYCMMGAAIGKHYGSTRIVEIPDKPGQKIKGLRVRGIWEHCNYLKPVHVHEKLARSAGGSISDEANCITGCFACHAWVGDHPKEALEIGLRLSRYVNEHDWHKFRTVVGTTEYDVCRKCGIVRRADDKNKPCRGVTKVALR